MLKIEIPADTCKKCPYLTRKVIDHNYYGETSEKTVCSLFGCSIIDFHPCEKCITQKKENQEDIRKYADFLVKEINKMAAESRSYALDKLMSRAVDKAYLDVNGRSFIYFADLQHIIENLKES